MFRFGVIGTGNMGEAILRGLLSKKVLPAESIFIFDSSQQKMDALKNELGVCPTDGLDLLLSSADIILFAVKPDVCGSIIDANRTLFSDKAILSIVTGWSGRRLKERLPSNTRIMRIMPNTPAMVGEGMSAFEANDTLTDDERAFAVSVFEAIGRTTTVKPELINAVTGVSGSGPAYAYMFIEALADGGVRAGLPRNKAYELAAQTLLGSAKMVLETKQHPGRLKDAVCSPAGTTIDAVAVLEKEGFRNAIIQAVEMCVKKAEKMDSI